MICLRDQGCRVRDHLRGLARPPPAARFGGIRDLLGALIHGLRTLGARKISLLAPYPLAAKVIDYIEHEGIGVVDSLCFEIPDNLEVGQRNPMQLLEDVRRLNTANVDVVVLSACVQMQSLPAIQSAERLLGLPVTSTAVCTARNMLDLLGLAPDVEGCGRMLTA